MSIDAYHKQVALYNKNSNVRERREIKRKAELYAAEHYNPDDFTKKKVEKKSRYSYSDYIRLHNVVYPHYYTRRQYYRRAAQRNFPNEFAESDFIFIRRKKLSKEK